MNPTHILKFRYPGTTRGKPVTIKFYGKEFFERSLKIWEEQGAQIVFAGEYSGE